MIFARTLATFALVLFAIPHVNAMSAAFDIEFTDSTYSVKRTDTFQDLLDAHNAATVTHVTHVDAMQGIDTTLYSVTDKNDYSVSMSATLNIGAAGEYTFQVGTDWGRGGGVALFDTASGDILREFVTHKDIWWNNNWNHRDVIETSYTLTESQYTIMWLGFEGCCAGSSTIRFAVDGGAFNTLDLTNIAPYVVPLPPGAYLLGPIVFGLIGMKRRLVPAESASSDIVAVKA